MAYQVDKFNGQFLTSVEDGTIDSTTDIRFVGKNYAGYGEVQNENFLHLLENFSNTTPPPKVVTGQVWYDSSNKKLKFYDGAKFKTASGAEVAVTAPSGLAVGEFWWDSSAKQLYTFTGTDFVLIGPESSPDLGTSFVSSFVIKDTANNNHTILKLVAGGRCLAVINQDSSFEVTTNEQLRAGLAAGDFPIIKKGITLADTNSSGVSQNDHLVWGTSSNALRLGGVTAANFVQKGDNTFTSSVRFYDPGFGVGGTSSSDTPDLRIYIDPTAGALIQNQLGESITVRITVPGPVTTTTNDVAVFSSSGIAPAETNEYTLGTPLARWNNIYSTAVTATTFTGDLQGNSTGTHIGNVVAIADSQVLVNASNKEIGYSGGTLRGTLYGNVLGNLSGTADDATTLGGKLTSTTADPDTIVKRDLSANITAIRFIGTADRSDQLLVGASYRSSSTSANANTIVVRDGDGDITANLVRGTATAARYADLAEKYLADAEYEVGTVVSIGGEKEVTACSQGERALGVVSGSPAYMMNSELEGGTYIALKGRVPVKVIGTVKKGDRLIAANTGYAQVSAFRLDIFAIALESSDNPELKIIEAVVI
jgi:hypothetical protein